MSDSDPTEEQRAASNNAQRIIDSRRLKQSKEHIVPKLTAVIFLVGQTFAGFTENFTLIKTIASQGFGPKRKLFLYEMVSQTRQTPRH